MKYSDIEPGRGTANQDGEESFAGAIASAHDTVDELNVINCAIIAAADEDNPLDSELRHIVLTSAASLLSERIYRLDTLFDYLEDYEQQ